MTEWNFACPDWKDRLREGRSLVPDLPLDRVRATRAVGIFNKLRLPDVAGKPQLRDAAGDWQRDIVAALFGSLDDEGHRHVRKILCEVPKKNSKTTGAGAIGVTALLLDDEPRQPYYIYGPTQAIAQRGFDQASGMILADPELKARFKIRAHIKTIEDLKTESTLRVQTFDESVATGVIPKGMIVDELHILGKVHYASRVLGQLWGGLVSKPGGFLLMITTQSDEQPAGVFKDELQLARGVRDGRVTGEAATVLPILYEFPEEFQTDPAQPWKDPACWPMVLPNLGRSVQIDLLRPQFFEAVEKGDAELNRWASQHLNIEIGLGLHSNRWAGADFWLDAAEQGLTLDDLFDRCEVAVVGIDGGGRDDLYGLTVAGRERDTGVWLAWSHAWALEIVKERRKDIASRLQDFESDGDLTFVETGTEMVRKVAELTVRVKNSGLMPEIGAVGVDSWGMGSLLDALVAAGLFPYDDKTGKGHIAPVRQGVGLTGTIKTVEFKLGDGMLRHDGSNLMAWCVGNAKAELKGSNLYIAKQFAGSGKIDPLISLLNAAQLLEAGPVADSVSASVYNQREMVVI
jgi:phage terminase large subunit-like protein